MAATIIRLKRRLNDDSVDSFVLNTKRRKIDSVKSDNNLSTIFNFVGTGKSPEDVLEHIKTPLQSEVNVQTKLDTSTILKKLKGEWKEHSKNNRFKVVNRFRFSQDTEEASSTDAKCTIVDVESNKDITSDALKSSEQFVYDFYTTNDLNAINEGLYDDALENNWSVCPLNMEIFNCRDQDNDTDESDDSNAENYFGNDYPDESEDSDEESDNYDQDDDDEESKQFRKDFRQAKLDDDTSYSDYYEDNDSTRSDCEEYDGTCTP